MILSIHFDLLFVIVLFNSSDIVNRDLYLEVRLDAYSSQKSYIREKMEYYQHFTMVCNPVFEAGFGTW